MRDDGQLTQREIDLLAIKAFKVGEMSMEKLDALLDAINGSRTKRWEL